MALYFASRGQGTLHDSSKSTGPPAGVGHPDARCAPNSAGQQQLYTATARVLLSGLGSDELLGGYSRHRVAFAKGGWEGLLDEVSTHG